MTVGDYDNDGRPDLFVTRWRGYALYRNRGDGTFEDVTEAAGSAGDRDCPPRRPSPTSTATATSTSTSATMPSGTRTTRALCRRQTGAISISTATRGLCPPCPTTCSATTAAGSST